MQSTSASFPAQASASGGGGGSVFQSVRDLKSAEGTGGRGFAAVLLLKKLTVKTSANGNPYLSLELGDRTGSFYCTVFADSPIYEATRTLGDGAVVRVEGRSETYQGRFSPRLTKMTALSAEELSSPALIENLVEKSVEDPVALWKEVEGFIAGIVRPEVRATAQAVFDEIGDAFRAAPAAVSMHHAYRHGLMEHTVHMARAARALLPLYPEVDRDLAIAGILLHDTGKTIEYEGQLAVKRSRRGILHGHVVLGYQLVRKAALKAQMDPDLIERLEHVILSHQGELEWGAAAMAATPEAVFVSMIDNLDARMGMVQQALRQGGASEEFSERIPGLSAPLLIRRPPGGV